jgi:hypothetical protein
MSKVIIYFKLLIVIPITYFYALNDIILLDKMKFKRDEAKK